MPDINGIPYVDATDLVSGWPATSQSVAQEVSDQLAEKLPYSYGTATPTTTDSGFLWYDSNSTPAEVKFWDGAAFQALTSGKILQVVRTTNAVDRTTTSTSYVDVTGSSVTITPTKTTSAIIVISTGNAGASWSGVTVVQRGRLRISDSSNNPIAGATAHLFGGDNIDLVSGTAVLRIPFALIAYATPASTSAQTYKMRFQSDNASTTISIANSTSASQMIAIEVGA